MEIQKGLVAVQCHRSLQQTQLLNLMASSSQSLFPEEDKKQTTKLTGFKKKMDLDICLC